MAIARLPPELRVARPLVCAICGVGLLLERATAGLMDAEGRQCFACVSHLSEAEKLIVGWAEFAARQRRVDDDEWPERGGGQYGGGGSHAWPDS